MVFAGRAKALHNGAKRTDRRNFLSSTNLKRSASVTSSSKVEARVEARYLTASFTVSYSLRLKIFNAMPLRARPSIHGAAPAGMKGSPGFYSWGSAKS
jgi:hypothetical protein